MYTAPPPQTAARDPRLPYCTRTINALKPPPALAPTETGQDRAKARTEGPARPPEPAGRERGGRLALKGGVECISPKTFTLSPLFVKARPDTFGQGSGPGPRDGEGPPPSKPKPGRGGPARPAKPADRERGRAALKGLSDESSQFGAWRP